jgi:Tat protein translocase TatB subunit
MGSLGTGELVVIVLVAIVVFGPRRLPELARKAAELIKQAREATQSFTDALDTEYDGVTAPLKELKSEYDETMQSIKKMVPVIPNMSFELPDGKPRRMKPDESAPEDGPSAEKKPDEKPSAEEATEEPTAEPESSSAEQETTDDKPSTDGEAQ